MCLLASCKNASDSGETTANDVVVAGDTLTIASESNLLSQIVVEPVKDTMYRRIITATGVVSAIPSCYAEVAAPFGGRVVRTLVNIGSVVKKGTPLYEISSSDYSEIVKNYLQAQSELAVAKKVLSRTKDLHDNKVASDKELDEAQLTYNQANQEFNHAKAVAHEYQINLNNAEVGQPMVIRSPISGKVLANNLVVGDYLKEDDDAKLIVADLSKVWVKVNIRENDTPLLEDVVDAQVSLVASPDSVFSGRITYWGGLLDEETRTVETLVECANPKGRMLPNMYASVSLHTSPHQYYIVPKGAVLQAEGFRYVLVEVAECQYRRTPVVVESMDKDHYIIIEGLCGDDRIITQGAFYLVDSK